MTWITDPRVAYFLEARECLYQVRDQKLDDSEFWANLLGAIANASMAAVGDDVFEGVMVELARRNLSQRTVQRQIKKDLGGGS